MYFRVTAGSVLFACSALLVLAFLLFRRAGCKGLARASEERERGMCPGPGAWQGCEPWHSKPWGVNPKPPRSPGRTGRATLLLGGAQEERGRARQQNSAGPDQVVPPAVLYCGQLLACTVECHWGVHAPSHGRRAQGRLVAGLPGLCCQPTDCAGVCPAAAGRCPIAALLLASWQWPPPPPGPCCAMCTAHGCPAPRTSCTRARSSSTSQPRCCWGLPSLTVRSLGSLPHPPPPLPRRRPGMPCCAGGCGSSMFRV
jgi:hypothetical protein